MSNTNVYRSCGSVLNGQSVRFNSLQRFVYRGQLYNHGYRDHIVLLLQSTVLRVFVQHVIQHDMSSAIRYNHVSIKYNLKYNI